MVSIPILTSSVTSPKCLANLEGHDQGADVEAWFRREKVPE